MDASTNAINWFEIYVADIKRAKRFYETMLDIEMRDLDLGEVKMCMFPGETGNGKVSGGLVFHPMRRTSGEGVLVYLNANPDLQTALDKIEPAGGKINRPKTLISPEIGYMAYFTDTEGNAVALHSMQ